MKRAYRNALSMIVHGSLICQSIDKQREPDRFLAHQQKQTTSDGVTTTTAPSADTGRYVEVRVK